MPIRKNVFLPVFFFLMVCVCLSEARDVENYPHGESSSAFNSADSLANLPKSYGKIISQPFVSAKGSTRNLIILVDAHSNISVQSNLSHILHYMQKTVSPYSVYVEGASGTLYPEKLKMFSDSAVNHITAQYLLKNGFITGSEYFSLVSDVPCRLMGAESQEAYDNNLVLLKDIYDIGAGEAVENVIETYSEQICASFDALFAELDNKYMQMVLSGRELMAFCSMLNEYFYPVVSTNPDAYPVLSSIAYITVQSPFIEMFIKKNVQSLSVNNPDDEELKIQAAQIIEAFEQEYDLYDLVSQTRIIFSRDASNINAASLRLLDEFYNKYRYIKELSFEECYLEILESYKKLYGTMADGRSETIFALRNTLLGLAKGIKIQLTPHEFDYFNLADTAIEQLIAPLFNLSDALNEFPEGAFEKIERARILTTRFYESVETRNEAIVKNISADLPVGETGVLIIGGYHKNIADLFEQNGFGVYAIMPAVDWEQNVRREISYSDQLRGKFSSLEKVIYYSWSTIVARLVSQPLSWLSSRHDALSPIVARQLALMVGTAAAIQRNARDSMSRESIIEYIHSIYESQDTSFAQLTKEYLSLAGNESVPVWPRMIDFYPVAHMQGYEVAFAVGSQTLYIEILPENVQLTLSEQQALNSAEYVSALTAIEFQGHGYTVTIRFGNVDFEELKHTEADLSAGRENVLSSLSQKLRMDIPPMISSDSVQDAVRNWNIRSFENLWNHPLLKDGLSLPFVETQLRAEYGENEQEERQKYLDSFHYFDQLLTMLNGIFQQAFTQQESLNSVTIESIPGDSRGRSLIINLVEPGDLERFESNAYAEESDSAITLYLPDIPFEHGVPNPAESNLFFQILKQELDTRVFGIPYPVAQMLASVLNREVYQENVRSLSDRYHYDLLEHIRRVSYLANSTDDLLPLTELRKQFMQIEISREQIYTSIISRYALSGTTVRLLDNYIGEIQKDIRRMLAVVDYEIAVLGMRLNTQTGENKPVFVQGYELIERLGQGAFGVVFRARKNGQEWAIKIPVFIDYDSIGFQQIDRKFKRRNAIEHNFDQHITEYLLTAQARGESINNDDGEENDYPIIAVPYQLSVSLTSYLSDRRLSNQERLDLMIKIVHAFSQIEERGIIVNDIKPDNIRVLEDGSISIIDYGLARADNWAPETLDQVTLGSTHPFLSPEKNGVNEVRRGLMVVLARMYSLESAAGNLDSLKGEFERNFWADNLLSNSRYTVFFDRRIPEIKRAISAGEYSDYRQLKKDLETELIDIVLSFYDSRSDIFTLGALFAAINAESPIIVTVLLPTYINSPQLKQTPSEAGLVSTYFAPIVNKMMDHSLFSRYQSFHEILDDLMNLRDKKIPVRQFPLFAPVPIDLRAVREAELSWELKPVDVYFRAQHMGFKRVIDQARISFKNIFSESEYAEQYETNFHNFIEVLNGISRRIEGLDTFGEELYALNIGVIPNDPQPNPRTLTLFFVDQRDLSAVGQDVFTDVSPHEVKIYLPLQPIFSQTTRRDVYQLLKREVDTRVYGIPYPAAILQESLLNLNEDSLFPGQIGVLSERMKNDFDFRLKTTIQDAAVSGSLDNVYLFRDQLLRTISDRFIDSIRAENDRYLSSQEKSALQKVILERTEYARFTLARLDNAFADMINTMSDPLIIDGFEFKEKIGYGQYGVVVRAEKDGVEWALKIPVTNRDGKDVSFAEFQEILRVHNNEFAIIREKVNFGYQGRLAQTDGYPLVIMPVFTGKTLEEKLREELSADEKLELAIRLVEEFIRIEQAGIVFTDFNPSNILILDDGSARAIDFGMARIADDIPDKLSATHYYAFYAHASPEVIGASDLKKALKDFSSAPLNELVYDIRRAFTSSFNRQNLEENPHYMRLVTDVIPSAKRKLFDPALPESERSAIRRELEQAVVNALMGFIDHQSDIFAVGTVLYTIFTGGFIGEPSEKTQIRSIDADPLLPLLNDSIDAELQNIIRTMLRHVRSERYQNFSEMRDALEKYRGRIQAIPAQFAVLEASFEQKTQALATAAYWDERPFNKDMFRYNQRPVPFSDVRYECEKVYGGDIRLYRNYLQRYVEFYELFEKIIEQLDTLSTGDLFLAVDSIPGDSVQRPLKIILVDEDNLRFFGLNALTRAIPEDVTVYLPYERVADPADRGEIIQVLKREIDENVYGISFTESVLIESLANANLVYERSVGAEGRPSVLGTMSDRMSDNFIREVKQAVADARQSQSPDPLYELRDTFSTIILAGPQLKRSLDRADALPPVTKQLVARLIDEVQKEAELSIIRLEYELADLAQSVTSPVIIRGFEIKELLGVGGYGIVYRVEKDGIEYAVKLPIAKHRADREPRMVREEKFLTSAELSRILNEQRKDAYFTNRVYGDVYQTRELDPAMKSYPLYVLPVFKGKTLWQYLDETIFTQDELIGIMIKIVAEFRILEENGIVMNDVSPNNIFLMEDGTVRIFDFGVALSEDHLPHSFDEPFQGGTRPFLSPERNQVNDAADDFLRMVYRYESLEQFLDNMDEYPSVFIRHFTRQQLRENRLLDAFLSDGLFQIKQQIANRQIKTLTDARNAVSAAVIPILAAMFDHRSDIFTLGTIFYWMGVMDKSGSVSDLELEKVASMDDVSTFPYLAERMRPELGGIVRKMIQKDPRNRYQNFEDIYRDLIRFSDQLQENHASFAGGMLQSLKQILYPDSPSGITSDMVRGIAESWKKWGVAEQMLGYLPAFRKNTQAVYNDLRTGLEPLGIDAVQYEESFRMFGELLPIILQKIGGVTLDQKELVLESVYGSGKNVVIHFVDAHNLTEVGLDALSVEHDNMVSMYLPANLENAEMFFQILKRELDIHVLSMHPVQAVVFETFLNPKGFLSKTLFVSDRISGRIRSLVKTAAETSVQKNDPKPLQDIIAHLRSAFRHIDAIRQKIESEKKLISLRPMFNSFLEELIQEILFNLSSAEVSLIEMMLAQGREIEVRGYIFLRKLGEGGFGRVFLAERDNTLWAVKVLNPLVAGQLRNRDFLDKLVRVHMNDQRMHAVAYNDVSTYEHEYSGYPFIAVPYAAGKTVSKYMNIRELSLPEKMAVLISITDAFIALEDKGIVYNDVSPADFYIRDDGTVRILDFGMAKSSNDETYDIQDAFIIGTMPYISPELEAFRLLEEFVRKMRDVSDDRLSDFMDSIKSKFEALVNADTLERNEKYQTFIAQTLVELKRQFQSQTIPLHRIRKELEQAVTAVMFSLIDHQSDQFEVGILFSEIVLGEPIGLNAAPYFFTGAVEFKDADPDFKPLDSIHPVLASIMKKTMRHKKSERYRNFKELKAALENFRDDIMEHAVVTAKYVGAHPQYNVQNRHIVGLGWKQHDVSSINVQEIEQFKEFLTARMDSIDRKLSEAFGDNAYSQTFRYFAEIVQRMSEQFQQAQAGQRSIRIDAVPGAPNAPPLEIIFVSGERLHEIGVSALTQKSSRQITMYFSIESITGGSPHIFFQNFKHEIDESVYNVGHTQAVLMESLLNPDDSQAVLGNVSARIRYDMSQVVQRAGFNDYDAAFSYLNDIVNQELVVRRSLETRKDITNREQIYAQQLAGNITAFALKSAGELTDRLLLDTEQVLDKVSIMNPPSAEHKQLGAYAELWTKRAVTSMLKTQIESQESRIARSNIQFDSFNTDEESRNAKKVYSASFSHYLETLQAIKAQFSTVAFGEEKDSIRIERIPGDSKQRPLTLYFVDKIELDHFGLNVYTVSDDTGVTIYLPRERAFLEQNNLVSVALLKFELDRHVYGLSYPQAVIAESIFNKKGTVEYTGVIGQISDRMRNDFEFFFAQAVQNTQVRGDLKYITLFRQYLEGIILKALEDKQIAESDTTLSPAEKRLFAEIIEDRAGEARYYLALADSYLSALSESMQDVSIQGFILIEKLGEGEYGRVYRAVKNGKEWALKIPKLQNRQTRHEGRSSFESDFKPVHDNEYYALHRAYDDVYRDEYGESLGYPLIAVPYKPAQTLSEKLSIGISQDEALVLISKILDEIIILHDKGVILNDINPGNILVFPDGSVRIIDFGMARLNSFIPSSLKYLGHKSLMAFASPEILGMGLVVGDLSLILQGTYTLEDFYVTRLENFIQLGFDKDDLASNPAYKKLVTETLPLLAEKGISGAVSGDETRKQMDREITAVLAQMLDQQSDVFSLGAVFYVMLTGSTIGKTDADFLIIDPFSPDGRQFSRWARFDPPLEKLDTIQYPAVAEVISTMLRHKRSERYRSMREVKAALQTTGFSELPPLQARLSRSERLSLRLQATLQSDLPTLLREAGVLQDDVDSLMELTDDQRIRGDFQLLGVVARLKHQQLHSVVLRAYARELVHLLITNAGIEEVTQRFIRQVTRSRFEQMRSVIEDNWDMRFSNDAHFMQELIDFYADSQFSGANRDVFSSPEFDNLASALKYAVGTRLYITLIFSPGEVYDAESFLDRQVLFVRILADTARQAGLNIAVFDRKTGEKIDSELISVIERTIFHSRAVESSL